MPKVNFKSYQNDTQNMPTELQLIVSCYGPFLCLKEAAEWLHRSYETIYALVRSGALRACRTGKTGGYIVSANEIVKFFEKIRRIKKSNGLRIKSTGHFFAYFFVPNLFPNN